MMTVDEILSYLGQFTHIVVRKKKKGAFPEYLGGGYAEQISDRFGDLEVELVDVFDNLFIIYVQ